jgi:hypothetical protein
MTAPPLQLPTATTTTTTMSKYKPIGDIIESIVMDRNYDDERYKELCEQIIEELEKQYDRELWSQDERDSWYEYQLWTRLCK